jgi:uncharacterized protein YbjT (DUF2867 family)
VSRIRRAIARNQREFYRSLGVESGPEFVPAQATALMAQTGQGDAQRQDLPATAPVSRPERTDNGSVVWVGKAALPPVAGGMLPPRTVGRLLVAHGHPPSTAGMAGGTTGKAGTMQITVLGGTGRIGSQVVRKLTAAGHEAVPAAMSTGVDLITGKGLDQALEGAEVVIDLANSPTFDEASLDFFRTSMDNLLAAGQTAGVRHQVVLSIVGVDQVPQLDYYRAKTLQEELLRQGPTPYSIVRVTQFFEFMDAVLSWTADGDTVRLPATPIQPIAAADVVDAVVEVATGEPLLGIRNFAGPDVFTLDELGRLTLAAQHDDRTVVTDDSAGMFAAVTGDVLTAGPDAHLTSTHYRDWIREAHRIP